MLAIKTYNTDLTTFRRSLRLMGDRFEISVVGENPVWADNCIDLAIAEISRIEKLLSAFNEDSPVNAINRNAGIKPVKVNAEVYRLIERSLKISDLTHGAFDIAYSTTDKTSDIQKIERNSVKFTNYKSVILDDKNTTVYLEQQEMRIGFGAIAKGYAADRAKYVLQTTGVGSGVINAGGDLLTWGLQPNNEPWTIATADPEQETQPYSNINISNMAVATSSMFEQNITITNKKYQPNLDAKNGFPVSALKRVSIVSPTAELSDAMATPIMAMGINAGLYLINQLQQIACVVIDDHDRVYTSKEVAYLSYN